MRRVGQLGFALLAGVLCMGVEASDDLNAKYFSRNTRYMVLKERVVLVERDRAGVVTMDEWPQLVFLGADGEHTVGDLIAHLGRQYQGGAPSGLGEQIRALVRDLASRGYVVVHDGKRQLPYYLAIPVEQQDKDRAKSLMESDNFIKRPAK